MENEPSLEMLERNRLRLKFNLESIYKKYEKVDDSRSLEVDPLTNEFYYQAGTQRKDIRKQQERLYAANENFGFSAISAPFNNPETLDNQPKLVKVCEKKNAKFSELLELTPWYPGNIKKEPVTSEMSVVVRHTNKEITCPGITVKALESMIRREGIQGEIISKNVVDGVAKIVLREPGTVRVKCELKEEDAARSSGNNAYTTQRQSVSIKKEPMDEGAAIRLPGVKREPTDDMYERIDRALAEVQGRQGFSIKKESLDESGFQQEPHCHYKTASIKVKKEPIDEEIAAIIDSKIAEMKNLPPRANALFRRSPEMPKNNFIDTQEEKVSYDDDIPSERSGFSAKSGFAPVKVEMRPMPGIEEEEAAEDDVASDRSCPFRRDVVFEDFGKNEEKETMKEDEEPVTNYSDDDIVENDEESACPSRLRKPLPFLGIRKRRSSVQVLTPKSKKSRDSDWGSVEVPRSCSGNESPVETDESVADGLWSGPADSIVNSFRSENGQTVVGLNISTATKMCSDSPDRVLLELWADYAADLAKEEAGEFDYVAKEEQRIANQAKRRNNHMQNGYKK